MLYTVQAGRVVLLLAGTDKGGQGAAITTARKRLTDWIERGAQ